MNNYFVNEKGQIIYYVTITTNNTNSSASYTEKLIELMEDKKQEEDKIKEPEIPVTEDGEIKRKIII